MPSIKPRIYFHADSDIWCWYSRLNTGERAQILNQLLRHAITNSNEDTPSEMLSNTTSDDELFYKNAVERLYAELSMLKKQITERTNQAEKCSKQLTMTADK